MVKQRELVLAASTVVALSAGLNYLFSAYAPQLGSRLRLNSTQLNLVGAAGNLGVYLSSPIIGRIVDRRGPRPLLVFAALALTSGYLVIRAFYLGGHAQSSLFGVFGVPGLVCAELLTGIGSTAGLSSAGNTVAKSYKKRRAAALSVVLSGFGLSAAAYSTLSSILLDTAKTNRRDTTPSFLLLIAIGSFVSMLVGVAFVRPAGEQGQKFPSATTTTATAATVNTTTSSEPPSETTRLVNSSSEDRQQQREQIEVNVSGWALFKELDFYLIFLYNGLCSGVGLCYINNLGTVLRSLASSSSSSSTYPTLAVDDLARTQSHLVSVLSIFNCLGRLSSGFGSDYFVHHENRRRRISRVHWMVLTATVLTLSQVCAYRATTVHGWTGLVVPTILTGFAHGSLFGISGVIGLERFGLRNFSGTNGILALAPALFGQTTNLIFGKIYDSRSHLPSTSSSSSLSPRPLPDSLLSDSVGVDLVNLLPPRRQRQRRAIECVAGRDCYAPAFKLTIGMAVLALFVAVVLATLRRKMKTRVV